MHKCSPTTYAEPEVAAEPGNAAPRRVQSLGGELIVDAKCSVVRPANFVCHGDRVRQPCVLLSVSRWRLRPSAEGVVALLRNTERLAARVPSKFRVNSAVFYADSCRGCGRTPALRGDVPHCASWALVDRIRPNKILRVVHARWQRVGALPLAVTLRDSMAVQLRQAFTLAECVHMAACIQHAKVDWTRDFNGEQFSLGRAFYTHLETGHSKNYFEHAKASDALVEQRLPGFQQRMRDLMGALVGAVVRPRYGFCSAGIHIFPTAATVAKCGGAVHFDVEGLAPDHLARDIDALTLVVMLQPAAVGGGLRMWQALYRGHEHPNETDCATPHVTTRYRAGDALLMKSRRLHQIRPFRGEHDRISATLHAVKVDENVWDSWF